MTTTTRRGKRRLAVDALAPWSLVTFFWISDLLLPYLYAETAQPWRRQSDMMATLEIQDVRMAFGAAVLYLLVFLGAYFAVRWTPRWRFGVSEPVRGRSTVRLVLNFLAALALFVVVFAVHPNANFVSRMELTVGPWGKVLFLAIGVLFAAFWLSATGLLKGEGRALPLTRVGAALTLAIITIVVFAPMEGRARMLMAVLYMTVAWHYFVRPFTVTQAWSILALGLVTAFCLDYVRLSQRYVELDGLEMAYGLTYGRQFDGILNLASVMRAVTSGYAELHHGSAWVADLANDIGFNAGTDSRSLFMAHVLRMPNYQAGFPLTRPGELFFAFGWSGIVFGAAILGAFSRIWYNWLLVTRPFGPASIAVYFTFLSGAGIVTQKNYLFSSLVMAVTYTLLIVVLAVALYNYRLTRAAAPRKLRTPVPARRWRGAR